MAVQAQPCLSHAFHPHDLGHAFGPGGGMLLDALGLGGCAGGGIGDAVFGGEARLPRSELTSNGNDDTTGFLPRKRARVDAAPALLEGLALPPAVQHGLGQVFPGDAQSSRAVGCGAASTSGRACLTQGVVPLLCNHDAEIDAIVRLQMERMRLGLQEARQRQLRAVVAAVDRATAGRLHAAEAELERARCRNAELEERLRQMTAEGQAWLGVARSHEAVAAGLRATLDQMLLLQQQQQPALNSSDDAEDALSCCFETAGNVDDGAACSRVVASAAPATCKSCRGADACVLLLPCRHLCLCRACEPAVDACPVCAATKNASLQVLLS